MPRAIHAGDRFALRVLQESLTYLASTITAVHAAIGIRRYILIGGFARAVGDLYIESLVGELRRIGCFGVEEDRLARMVRMGPLDDDCGLVGAGIFLDQQYRARGVDCRYLERMRASTLCKG